MTFLAGVIVGAIVLGWVYEVRGWIHCNDTSPEGLRCVMSPGHDGNHTPSKGKGWSWG